MTKPAGYYYKLNKTGGRVYLQVWKRGDRFIASLGTADKLVRTLVNANILEDQTNKEKENQTNSQEEEKQESDQKTGGGI